MVSLWEIYFPTCSLKSSCFHFCRCGLLFRSQQNSEEFPVYPCEGGFLMNCSVIEMGRVSLLYKWRRDSYCFNFGNKRYITEFIKLQRNRGDCPNISDQESDGIHTEKSQENLCWWWLLSTYRKKKKIPCQIVFHLCKKCMRGGRGWRIHELRPDGVLAVQPELPLIAQDSFLWWIKRLLYVLWFCWVMASHASQHRSLFQTAIIKNTLLERPAESKWSH